MAEEKKDGNQFGKDGSNNIKLNIRESLDSFNILFHLD